MYVLAPNQTVEKFPYSIGELRKDNPQTSFPKSPSNEMLASWNVFPVVSTGATYDSATQVAEQSGCEYSDANSRWETSWTVRDKTADEIAADQQRIQDQIVRFTQQRLDDFARTRGYDNILSACTYADSAIPSFAAEGNYCRTQRDATWVTLLGIMNDVKDGLRSMPSSYADIEPELPVLQWP